MKVTSPILLGPIHQNTTIKFLSVLFFLSSAIVLGQNTLYDIQFLSFKDGLQNRWATCVSQDSTGLIWIGTANNITTYDGQEFMVVKDREGFPFSHHITGLQLTEDNYFRVFTTNGDTFLFSPYDHSPEGYDFKQETFPNKLKRIPGPASTTPFFFKDQSNQLFGPDFLNRIDSAFFRVRHQPTPWETVLSLNSQVGQVTEFDTSGTVVRQFAIPVNRSWRNRPNLLLEGQDQLRCYSTIYPETKELGEILWSLDKTGVASPLILKKDGKPISIRVFDKYTSEVVFVLKRDPDHNLWLASSNTLWVFDPQGELIADLSERLNGFVGAAWSPQGIFSDNSGNFWISTNAGVFLVSARPKKFTTYLKEEHNTSVRGIIELDDGKLLVGTYQKNRKIDPVTGITSTACFSSDCAYFNAFHRLASGEILIGVYGLKVVSLENEALTIKEDEAYHAPHLIPYYYPSAKTFFFGSTEGLYSSATYANFLPYPKVNGFELLRKAIVTHFHETPSGLWIGSSNGLFLLHPQKGIIRSELSKHNVKHFHVDDNGIFWVATSSAGLLRWNPATNETRNYTTKEGLTHNTLYAVYQDDEGYLWLPSNKGLMRFNPTDGNIISFHPEDGIAHEEFNTYSHYEASDGTLYFGGLDGLTSFHPSSLNIKKNSFPLRISNLTQYVAETDKIENRTASLRRTGKIEMAPGDKFFLLAFNLLDYTSSNISYAWKMEGVFEDWNYQKENSLRLLGLPYGTHNLRIKARSSSSGWIDRELLISVVILRPFYLSLPFLLTMPILLALLTFGFFWYRTARLRKRSLQLQREVTERTEELALKNKELQNTNSTKDRLFAMISHDLRAPLITLRGLTQKVNFLIERDRIPEIRQMGITLDGAVDRTQKLLDNLLSWAIVKGEGFAYNPEPLIVQALMEETVGLYQDSANAKGIILTYQASKEKVFADSRSVLTILRNLVDNAIKFTSPGGTVLLKAACDAPKGYVSISITDTGVGIPSEQLQNLFLLENRSFTSGTSGEKGTGLGLILCTDLASLNQGEIIVTPKEGIGTTFTLRLPVSSTKD